VSIISVSPDRVLLTDDSNPGEYLKVLAISSCAGGTYGGELMFINPANNPLTSLLGSSLNGSVMHGAIAYSDNDTVGSY
jgi:hypothetical protein